MNKRNLIFIGSAVLILAVGTFAFIRRGSNIDSVSATEALDSFGDEVPQDAPPLPTAKTPASAQPAAPGFLPTEMADPALYEAFNTNIAEMAKCLSMQMGKLDKNVEINFDTFNQAIATDLGNIVAQEEDWSTTDIRTSSGEIRRILIQTPPPGEGDGERKLKYMSLLPDGTTKDLALSQDQSDNPSETLLASLESDGEVVATSKANRIFYENGDDMSVSVRNNKLYSFTLNHEGRAYRCKGMDAGATVDCACQ